MALQTVRPPTRDPREPVQHELDALRFNGQVVLLSLIVRHAADGAWRARLRFLDSDSGRERETVEIFCAESEADLWESVRELAAITSATSIGRSTEFGG
jgi:hypothetical protein